MGQAVSDELDSARAAANVTVLSPLQCHQAVASYSLAFWLCDLSTSVALVVSRSWALGVVALVDLRIGIAELDRDVTLQLCLKSHGLHTANGLHHG
jgi:hypothetical protein